MRQIRNTCREFMTNDRHEILPDEQQAWFETIRGRDDILPFLFKPRPEAMYPKPFGYGLLRKMNEKWWVSGGLLPDWRGKGYGKWLFTSLTERVHAINEDAWLTVWEHNERAVKTYQGIGYQFEAMKVDAYSPPIMIMVSKMADRLRMHRLLCPICGVVTNKTRGPYAKTGLVAEHPPGGPRCPGSELIAPWVPDEVQ